MHFQVNPIVRNNVVLSNFRNRAALAVGDACDNRGLTLHIGTTFVLVLKNSTEPVQVNTIRFVEIEELVADSDEQLMFPDGIGSLGKDWPEVFCASRIHA